jgi:hypothetical protein
VIAALYGLGAADLRWILRDCDHPRERLADPTFCRSLDPKGFWRVDRERDPELRHSVLTLVAFDELRRYATLDAFLPPPTPAPAGSCPRPCASPITTSAATTGPAPRSRSPPASARASPPRPFAPAGPRASATPARRLIGPLAPAASGRLVEHV